MKLHLSHVLLIAIICFDAMMTSAQEILYVENISVPNEIYRTASNEAQIIIRCDKNIPLTRFSSTMDKDELVIPFKTDLEGNDSIYKFKFRTGKRYLGRTLTVYTHSCKLTIEDEDLKKLKPTQSLTFNVFDPNVPIGCYRTHLSEGLTEFRSMNYEEARNHFELALKCYDYDIDTDKRYNMLARVDSIIDFRKRANDAYNLKDYSLAYKLYGQILELNSKDEYAEKKQQDCQIKLKQDCDVYFKEAEKYRKNKNKDKASEYYQKVIDMHCSNSQMAYDRLERMKKSQQMKYEHAHVLTYQWQKDVPFGIHYGSYMRKRWGGFFHLSFSGDIFKLPRKGNTQIGDHPELDVSFGGTSCAIGGSKNPVPIHIFFGPGITTKFYLGEYETNHYPNSVGLPENPVEDLVPSGKNGSYENYSYTATNIPNITKATDKDREKYIQTNTAIAVSPVIGILVKYSYAAFRLSYSYRFSINKDLEDFIGPHRISIGVGVAF